MRSRAQNDVQQEAGWIVFARDCKAGESFAIRNHKYLAPFLISAGPAPAAPPNQAAPAKQDRPK